MTLARVLHGARPPSEALWAAASHAAAHRSLKMHNRWLWLDAAAAVAHGPPAQGVGGARMACPRASVCRMVSGRPQ